MAGLDRTEAAAMLVDMLFGNRLLECPECNALTMSMLIDMENETMTCPECHAVSDLAHIPMTYKQSPGKIEAAHPHHPEQQ